jgi:mono/diheme cytochrome c family protein
MKPFWIVISTVGALIVAAILFAVSGIYNVSARVPHLAPTTLLLEGVRERSIEHHSSKIEWPASDGPALAMAGAIHFDATCRKCHGAPGIDQEEFAQGLYPKPPNLSAEKEMSREEIFWVIDNGLKMTGMPAFGVNHEHDEIIAMTAFIQKLPELDAGSYAQFIQEAKAQVGDEDHHHGASGHDEHADEPDGHTHDTENHH